MKSGIYKITNLVNGKIYVGYAQNMYKRKYYHFFTLSGHAHSNCYLQEDFDLFGEENLQFEILEKCEISLLAKQEHYWATLLKVHNRDFGYNIAPTDPNGRILMAEETRDKMAKTKKLYVFTEEHKRNLSISASKRKWTKEMYAKLKGRKRSPEMGIKVGNALRGRKLSKETIEKLRKNNANKKSVYQYNSKGTKINEFESLTIASEITGVPTYSIYNSCKGRNIRNTQYTFQYGN